MGKASRNKHIKRQQAVTLERYGGVKLSEALIDICEPYDYDDLSLDDYKKLIMMTIAAWNVANQPEEKRAEQLLGFLQSMPALNEGLEMDLDAIINEQKEPPAVIVMAQILNALMRRKLELYPNDDRIVTDFKLTDTATDRHLYVSSIIPGTTRQLH